MAITTPSVRDAVRLFNKYVLNPVMLLLAGRPHWYAAVIRHVGRTSGREYATPVVADRVVDGFLIPLPYGTDVDWLRNVQAAGRARLTVHGTTHDVVAPQIVDAQVAASLLPSVRAGMFNRFGVQQFLRLKEAA
ncbi:hypothetical protein MHAS_04359 [Mycolicibacterium hassiacum DSM 44199]|jgi:deazaflavin-dependent oxidoreductase (nitroreductase family)|uniref:nitroreductase family deazaflavin-dependent oxidoreductase n=1 Tax=Mycolicibacterium hassiacum TaxID=46351 RepID=UPI00035DD8BC|nr:nitroreductase family deazaflavin-dependent oxidoreductase [Mycolicibacterium hassiacum]MBX5487110.1 nitroreductase family deazaflavin-dependent oxidoreductase [Mycolicibacterium hassiacum]MDA4085443.1 nitroreductase [Mycolicibacterium hassiacum DSM 44199]PZN21581.1 MAG: nitroreductase family deazaflavin-dependent oxidoreductase [Mycolicibacterium hassiacum]VCT92629.1 hypothetical protein MHAS_04359 [Mycolicibacterium hassiacum DSM 44199]